MAQIDGAGQQDTDNQNAEALQAALAQRQVTLQGQPQGGSDVPSHENSDPVSDESEILGSVSLLPENVVYRAPAPLMPTSPLQDNRNSGFQITASCAHRRVEDGRGGLGHAATLRFPSPLIKPDVRISRIRLSDWFQPAAHGGTPSSVCVAEAV